jgi:hypothetical protein
VEQNMLTFGSDFRQRIYAGAQESSVGDLLQRFPLSLQIVLEQDFVYLPDNLLQHVLVVD